MEQSYGTPHRREESSAWPLIRFILIVIVIIVVYSCQAKWRGYYHLYSGKKAFEKNNNEQAEKQFSAAARLLPNNPDASCWAGIIQYKKGHYDRAEKYLSRAIEVDANYAIAYEWRGIVYYETGKDEQAIEDFTMNLQLKPYNTVIYHRRATVYGKDLILTRRSQRDTENAEFFILCMWFSLRSLRVVLSAYSALIFL